MGTPSRAEEFIDRSLHFLFGWILRPIVVLFARDAQDALQRTRKLRAQGFLTSFDVMVEDVRDPKTLERVHSFYCELLRHMNGHDRGNIVLKPTSLGLDADTIDAERDKAQFLVRLRALLDMIGQRSVSHDLPTPQIEIDAESTKTLEHAFAAIATLRKESPEFTRHIRVALPMHILALPEYSEKYGLLEHPVRIVKGAGVYNEEARLLVDEATVKERYGKYLLLALSGRTHPYVATVRDKKLLRELLHRIEELGYKKEEFTIQMLYGLWTGLGRQLLREGYRVSVYIPIVLPWCARASDGYVLRRVRMFRLLLLKWFHVT